ncbi:probable protein phosphatase 2C 12 [Chenopodium quinoa]|uniref:probable protein phosphatase 2C 12 n=1 Tax=Chenopodium quinoa TaxID=63459 RepID=UPI000B779BAD|nr:probable protein phosphatase 2C 12 [Chenopodium quinoa]
MGVSASAPISVIPDGLGSVIYDQDGMKNNDQQIKPGFSIHSQRGCKPVNQDCAVLCQGYGSEDGVLCGVFDGHGKNGHLASKIISRRLPLLLLDKKNAVAEVNENYSESHSSNYSGSSPNNELLEWEEAYMNAFPEMDEQIKMVKKVDFSFSGSTAVVALKQGDDLLIANLGDSRAILGTKSEVGITTVQLTIDLKPGTPDEADRIRSSNGRVFALKDEPGAPRAWLPRVYTPGIAMSRCFGDFVMKNYGIISTPVITYHQITSDDVFILLATDGIWDVLSNEEVTSIVCGVENEEMAAKAVVDAAVAAWKTKIAYNRCDDCTAVCYFLQKKD